MKAQTFYQIDGREVVTSGFSAHVGDYTVYQNKVWKITGSIGSNHDRRLNLERPKHNQSIWIDVKEEHSKVIKPTGYIAV